MITKARLSTLRRTRPLANLFAATCITVRSVVSAPRQSAQWWTGNCPGVGGACALARSAFEARAAMAIELGVSPEEVDVVQS